MILTKETFQNNSTNIICFDPSMNYTGWLIYHSATHEITNYGCIRKDKILSESEFDGVMEERMQFAVHFSWHLRNLMQKYDPVWTRVVSERPHGSQSVNAVWAMALSSQAIISSSIGILNKTPTLYTEREAKMQMFQTRSVSKEKTMKTMWKYWLSEGITPPEERWYREQSKTELRKMKEAVADAMLILNLHLYKLYEQLQ